MKIAFIGIGLCIVISITFLSGCVTSSGVVSTGQNTYMITGNQWGFHGPGQVKAAELQQAADYCKSRGKVLRVTKTVETGLKFGSEPAAEVCFKCLDLNDPELKQPANIEEIVR
jgi:hypothetical protein